MCLSCPVPLLVYSVLRPSLNACILAAKTYLIKPWTEYVSFPIVSFPTTLFLCHGFVFFSVIFDVSLIFVFAVVPCFDLFPYSISAFFRKSVQRKSMIPVKKSKKDLSPVQRQLASIRYICIPSLNLSHKTRFFELSR